MDVGTVIWIVIYGLGFVVSFGVMVRRLTLMEDSEPMSPVWLVLAIAFIAAVFWPTLVVQIAGEALWKAITSKDSPF